MHHEIEIENLEGMSFKTTMDGHEVIMDAGSKVGGENRGPRPKPFMLTALGGCTGMDVVSLLKKMRVHYDDFKIKVSGELTDQHPKYYHKIRIEYHFWGKELVKPKVEKAINLSIERYCGVIFTMSRLADIEHEIFYYED